MYMYMWQGPLGSISFRFQIQVNILDLWESWKMPCTTCSCILCFQCEKLSKWHSADSAGFPRKNDSLWLQAVSLTKVLGTVLGLNLLAFFIHGQSQWIKAIFVSYRDIGLAIDGYGMDPFKSPCPGWWAGRLGMAGRENGHAGFCLLLRTTSSRKTHIVWESTLLAIHSPLPRLLFPARAWLKAYRN